ncbi:hypothetical protein Osc2_08500 [Ruminococcus sp. 25CYCFAH16]
MAHRLFTALSTVSLSFQAVVNDAFLIKNIFKNRDFNSRFFIFLLSAWDNFIRMYNIFRA